MPLAGGRARVGDVRHVQQDQLHRRRVGQRQVRQSDARQRRRAAALDQARDARELLNASSGCLAQLAGAEQRAQLHDRSGMDLADA